MPTPSNFQHVPVDRKKPSNTKKNSAPTITLSLVSDLAEHTLNKATEDNLSLSNSLQEIPKHNTINVDTETYSPKTEASHLQELVSELMSDLSKQSTREGVPQNYQITENDRTIAGKISYAVDVARKKGKKNLDKTVNDIQEVIKSYGTTPSQSRFLLSAIIYQKFTDGLSQSPHAGNKNVMKKWKIVLSKRLELFKGMSKKDLPCPIGSFGEKPPEWFILNHSIVA